MIIVANLLLLSMAKKDMVTALVQDKGIFKTVIQVFIYNTGKTVEIQVCQLPVSLFFHLPFF